MIVQNGNTLSFFATTPKGLELLLVDELRALGAETASEKLAGVAFRGDLALAYKACLWSRLANRILLPLIKVPAATPEELYAGVQMIAWDEHLAPQGTLAVHFTSTQSQLSHSLFGAQKVKDAIVDQFREKYGVRPTVAREQPELSIHIYVYRDQATVSLDLSGESLHKRSYRLSAGVAPLKENLAAAILLRAGWPELAKEGGALLDPMCGSGTLLIEGALMAADWAPGLQRSYFGFLGWKKHQTVLWQALLREAQERAALGVLTLPPIVGYDQEAQAIKLAFENLERAGLRGKVHVEKRDLSVFEPKYGEKGKTKAGLVVVNPPYGERLGEVEELHRLYVCLGEKLREAFVGWKAAVFTGNPELGKQMGLRASRYYALFNGSLPCKLLLFEVESAYFVARSPQADNERRIRAAKRAVSMRPASQGMEMFKNRLSKNQRHLKRKATRQGENVYRVYDADLPEYAFTIEVGPESAKVQEFQAPKAVDAQKVLHRRQEVLALLPELLGLPPGEIYFEILPRKQG